MKAAPEWDVEGRDWPNRAASRFVHASGILWHVQMMGEGPVLLLIHGTGAATHSFGRLAVRLRERFRLVIPDLPGHGFTEMPRGGQFGLPQMANALAVLLQVLDVEPYSAVGHSAGAAIAIRMALDRTIAPRNIISLNGALLPFPGMAAVAFPVLAKMLFLNPFAAPFLAWRASDPKAVSRLIAGTGSTLSEQEADYYARLLRTERHIAAAVGMMANWDLHGLKQAYNRFETPLLLVAAERDRAVPPSAAANVKQLIPGARIVSVPGYGHLAHEEAPAIFADIIATEAAAK
jgi:magnesium chelatase accessory protein